MSNSVVQKFFDWRSSDIANIISGDVIGIILIINIHCYFIIIGKLNNLGNLVLEGKIACLAKMCQQMFKPGQIFPNMSAHV